MGQLSRVPIRAFLCALLPAVALLSTPAGPAFAQAPDQASAVRSGVESWLKGRYKVDDVRRTPLPGIWEVRLGNDLIYVDEKGQHAFIDGSLIDLRANRNLTRERIDELSTINFKDLPLELAFKQVTGNGKRVLAIFEDPNCGYCKQMRRDLAGIKDLTLYTFVVPILSPDSEVKARKALCAEDKARAWNDLMLSGKVPGNAGNCDTQLARIRELAQKLGVSGTPTGFFANGKRLRGYVPAAQLEKMLDENSRS